MKKFVLIAASFAALVTLGGGTPHASADQAECPCFTIEDVRDVVEACDANNTPAECSFGGGYQIPQNYIGCNLDTQVIPQEPDVYSASVTILNFNNADYTCAYVPGGEDNEWNYDFFEGREDGEACRAILEAVADENPGC